jgi:hypothetical protein
MAKHITNNQSSPNYIIMKSIFIEIAAGAVISGVLFYVFIQQFTRFYMELIPIVIYSLYLMVVTGKRLRAKLDKIQSMIVVSIGLILSLLTAYFLLDNFDSRVGPLDFSGHAFRIFAILGMGFFFGLIINLIIYARDTPTSRTSP